MTDAQWEAIVRRVYEEQERIRPGSTLDGAASTYSGEWAMPWPENTDEFLTFAAWREAIAKELDAQREELEDAHSWDMIEQAERME